MDEFANTAERVRHLFMVKHMTVADIARTLKLTPGAVSNALRRAGVPPSTKPRPRNYVQRPTIERQERDPDSLPRDPCFNCGVRREIHDQYGCKRWTGQ